jgi:hypothetical protein
MSTYNGCEFTESEFKWAYIATGVFMVVLFSSVSISTWGHECTAQEAIKAGLVQDKNGHWVKAPEPSPVEEK